METEADHSDSVQPSHSNDGSLRNKLPDCERLLLSLKSSSNSCPSNGLYGLYSCHNALSKFEGRHRCDYAKELKTPKNPNDITTWVNQFKVSVFYQFFF